MFKMLYWDCLQPWQALNITTCTLLFRRKNPLKSEYGCLCGEVLENSRTRKLLTRCTSYLTVIPRWDEWGRVHVLGDPQGVKLGNAQQQQQQQQQQQHQRITVRLRLLYSGWELYVYECLRVQVPCHLGSHTLTSDDFLFFFKEEYKLLYIY